MTDRPAVPLTHHEIMAVAAPFTRSGRHVDLGASDRLLRRVAFKAQDRTGLLPGLQETLQLTVQEAGGHRLTRCLMLPNGMQARLRAEGDKVPALLAAVDAIDPLRQWRSGPGYVLALGLRLHASAAPSLTDAELRVEGLTVEMQVSSVKGIAAELRVSSPGGVIAALPDDLLAVLGSAWSPLQVVQGVQGVQAAWTGSVALSGHGAQRAQDAQGKLEQAARHLVRTLAESPAQFHPLHRLARYAVALRRAVPLAVCLGLIGAALSVPALDLAPDSVFKMLIFNSPPLLLAAFVVRREMPRVEWPRLPRRLRALSWRRGDPVAETGMPALSAPGFSQPGEAPARTAR